MKTERVRKLGHEFRKNTHRDVWVRVYVDKGIASMVEHLNSIKGVYTDDSCQGTIGEGGSHPYRGYVSCHWSDEALPKLKKMYDVEVKGLNWGIVREKIVGDEESKKVGGLTL